MVSRSRHPIAAVGATMERCPAVPNSVVLNAILRRAEYELMRRLDELRDEKTVYVTELVGCTHKPRLRAAAPLATIQTSLAPAVVLGLLVHEGLERVVLTYGGEEGCGIDTEVEVEAIVEGVRVKGRADIVVECDERCTIVEVKTSRSLRDTPKQHHVLQLQLYHELFKLRGRECDLELVYITPEGIRSYTVSPAEGLLERLVADYVADAARPRWDWECRYCPYREICPFARRNGGGER